MAFVHLRESFARKTVDWLQKRYFIESSQELEERTGRGPGRLESRVRLLWHLPACLILAEEFTFLAVMGYISLLMMIKRLNNNRSSLASLSVSLAFTVSSSVEHF